jgi:hypothetical protein
MEVPRSVSGIRTILDLGRVREGTEGRWASEAFEAWRGDFATDAGILACGIPVKETRGEDFSLACDGSVPQIKEGEALHAISSVTVIRNRDRKIMSVEIMKQLVDEDNSFIPEADAAVRAAQISHSLLKQGATSTQCVGDSQVVGKALAADTCAETTFRVAPIKSLVPNVGTWYLPRTRRRNHLADWFTKIDPGKWDTWIASDRRPPSDETDRFVNELFHFRGTARSILIQALPSAVQGEGLKAAAEFVANDIQEDEFYLKCAPYAGKVRKGLIANLTDCFTDAFKLHTRVPRLPILINRWLLGNIKTRKRAGLSKEIQRRCEMYMRREWGELHSRSAPRLQGRRGQKSEMEALREAVRDVERGGVGKARKRLSSKGVLDISDPLVQAEVTTKYPQIEKWEAPDRVKGWDPMSRVVEINEKAHAYTSLVYAMDFKLPDGRAPGLSGLTYEWMKRIGHGAEGRLALCQYAIEMVNSNLPPEIQNFYRAKHIVPLCKKEGTREVRPIGVGDCIRRWAAIAIGVEVLGHKDQWPSSDFKGKLTGQYGVGVKSGAETMLRMAETYQAQFPNRVTAKVDATNGYNALRRSVIWEGVIEVEVASLERYAATFYTGASLVVDGAGLFKLSQVMGVDQGDPLGPLFFAIGIWVLCKDIMVDNPRVVFLFYIDDLIMQGKADDLANIISQVREGLLTGNLALSTDKGKQDVFCPVGKFTEDYLRVCSELGAVGGADGMVILGIPVGRADYVEKEIKNTVQKYEKELTLLLPMARLFPKHALSIFSKCTLPTFNYTLRNTSPVYMGEVESDISDMDRAFLLHVLQRPCLDEDLGQDNKRWQLASLPATMGGLGVRNAYLTGRAAYMAAWGDCLASQAELDPDAAKAMARIWRTPAGRTTHIYKGMEKCMSVLQQYAGDVKCVGPTVQATVETLANYVDPSDPPAVRIGGTQVDEGTEVKGRRQKALSSAIYKSIHGSLLALVNSNNAPLQTTMRSNTGGAICNAWVTEFDPAEFTSEGSFLKSYGWFSQGFSAEEFRASVQIRLGLSDPFINEAVRRFPVVMCHCKRVLTKDGWHHLLSCGKAGLSERHDAIVQLLIKAIRETGILVRGDKQSPGIGPKLKRADFEIVMGGITIAFDVRVVSSHSGCYAKHVVERVHVVSFGEDGQRFRDFITARDDGAAAHVGRYTKIREFVPTWTPSEGSFVPPDRKKEAIPDERRLLKHIEIDDPARGQINFIPLVFEVGGRVTPEVEVLIKDIVEATVESDQGVGPTAHAGVHRSITTALSNKLMRGAARNIIRMRGAIAMGGGEKPYVRVPDPGVGGSLSATPTNWIPRSYPLFSSSATVTQAAHPAPSRPSIVPTKRGHMKVHLPAAPAAEDTGPTVTPISSLLSLSSSSTSISTSSSGLA